MLRYLVVVSAVFGLALTDINSELDGWLKDWYSSRMVLKTGLEPLEVSWVEGSLWWKKVRTLNCTGGLLDLTETGGVRRVGFALEQILPNSSRPWVTAALGLAAPARIAFYGCGLQPNSTGGMITGKVATAPLGGIDLLFTFRTAYRFWCSVQTLSLDIGPNGLSFEDFVVDGLSLVVPNEAQEEMKRGLLQLVRARLLENWSLVGSGPKCKDSFCRPPEPGTENSHRNANL